MTSRLSPTLGVLSLRPSPASIRQDISLSRAVRLSANENILGCSPRAREAFIAAAHNLTRYPDGTSEGLRQAISQRYGLEPDRLIFGSGSEEILQLLNLMFLNPGDNIVQGQYGFAAYAIGAAISRAIVVRAPEQAYTIDIDAILAAVDERTRIIFITNPGNPTGTYISSHEIERLHRYMPRETLLVLDAAYAEFAEFNDFEDGLTLARGTSNVVVTHTFSKLHGLAGLRLGWAYAPTEVVDWINRIRLPYNVNVAAQAAALAALADDDFQSETLAHVRHWRGWLALHLEALGLEVVRPLAASFVLVGFPNSARSTADEARLALARAGILVRALGQQYNLPNHLRITVGLEDHNHVVVNTLAELLKDRSGPQLL